MRKIWADFKIPKIERILKSALLSPKKLMVAYPVLLRISFFILFIIFFSNLEI